MKTFDPSVTDNTVRLWVHNVQQNHYSESFTLLYLHYKSLVYSTCASVLRYEDQAGIEDVVSDVFAKLWATKIESYQSRNDSDFKTWLCQVAKNKSLDLLRKQKHHLTLDPTTCELIASRNHGGTHTFSRDTRAHLRHTELVATVERLLETRFTPQVCRVLRSRLIDEYTNLQIAELTGMRYSHVSWTISHYLPLLQEYLMQYYADHTASPECRRERITS